MLIFLLSVETENAQTWGRVRGCRARDRDIISGLRAQAGTRVCIGFSAVVLRFRHWPCGGCGGGGSYAEVAILSPTVCVPVPGYPGTPGPLLLEPLTLSQ
eukprot:1908117-Rhodomonas_salina.3